MALRTVDTDEFVPLKERHGPGFVLPIRFRIEESAELTTRVRLAENATPVEIGEELRDRFGLTDLEATTLLRSLDVSAVAAGSVLQTVYGEDADSAAVILDAGGYVLLELATALQETFGLPADSIAATLNNLGATVTEIESAIVAVFGPLEDAFCNLFPRICIGGELEAQTTIGAGGGTILAAWGKGAAQTVGQTIIAPGDNILTDFSFWLGNRNGGGTTVDIDFRAYVYAWSNATSRATGPALFTSAVLNYQATDASPFTKTTIQTGGLSLASAATYVLFFSTSGEAAGTPDDAVNVSVWNDGAGPSVPYAGGGLVSKVNGDDKTAWTESSWGGANVVDLQFEANFIGSGS